MVTKQKHHVSKKKAKKSDFYSLLNINTRFLPNIFQLSKKSSKNWWTLLTWIMASSWKCDKTFESSTTSESRLEIELMCELFRPSGTVCISSVYRTVFLAGFALAAAAWPGPTEAPGSPPTRHVISSLEPKLISMFFLEHQ